MPTAAKLVAALCLAVLGYMVSEQIKPLFPESTSFGIFSYLNAALGVFCGWSIVGPRAGRRWSVALSNGLTGAAALVFLGLFVQGANRMVEDAFKRRYDSPVEAFAAVFERIIEYAEIMSTTEILVTLLVGAVVTGILAEIAGRLWR